MTAPAYTTSRALLENGMQLSREEFEERYWRMPEVKKAELIEGVVYMPSPVRYDSHGVPHAAVMFWLGLYRALTHGVGVADSASVRLDGVNEPQPDGTLFLLPSSDGQIRIDADGILSGSPELVVEVAASSKSIDRNAKFRAYQRNGVREYVLWRVEDEAIDWFVNRDGGFVAEPLPEDGIYKSTVFPGLWLAVPALLHCDLAHVMQTMQAGAATVEHAAFVQRLNKE